MKKRLVLWLLLLAMVATLLPAALPLTAFAVNEKGEVTRSEWVQQLVATFEMTVEADNYPDNYFSDLTGEEEYYRDVLVAVEFGVVELEAGLPFRPDDPVTRDFAAHTLNFCLGFQLEEGVGYAFSDSAEVPHADDAQIAVNRKWLALVDGAFKPEQAITEAEMTAMLADAKTVLGQSIVDEEYESSFVFTDEVKVLETAAAQMNDDGTLAIAGVDAINQGELFAVYFDGVPFVYRAEAVTSNNGLHTVTVTQLDAGEYLVSVDAEGTKVGNLGDFEVAEGLEAIYVMDDGAEYSDVRLIRDTTKIKEIHLSETIKGVKITVDLTNMKLHWKVKGTTLGTMNAVVKVTGHTFVTGSVGFGTKLSDHVDKASLVLGAYPIGALGKVTVSADIKLDGSITISYGANFEAGVEYDHGQFRIPHPNFHKTHFSVTVEATLDIGITLKAAITNIPLVDAEVSASVGIRVNCVARYHPKETPERCLHLDGWVYAEVNAKLVLGTKKFNKPWKYKLEIWNRNNSPVRSVSHYEDGEKVAKCTRGESDFVKEFGHNTYYYSGEFNGGTSKYHNGGLSAVVRTPTYKYDTDEDGNAIITDFNGGFASIAIPNTIDGHTVVAIGDEAFEGHSDLRNVTLPANVTTIEYRAFADCTGLKTITLSEKLTTIGNQAFYNCRSLVTVDIPDSVTEIEYAAFENCKNLSRVKLSNNLKTIGGRAFADCTALPKLLIPKTLETVEYHYATGPEYGLFTGCTALKNVTLEDGITAVPYGLFMGCPGFDSIVIPDSVTEIEGSAFSYCSALKNITFSKNLVTIGYGAFENCQSLVTVEIPDSVTEIGGSAFAYCKNLSGVKLSKNLKTIGRCAFADCTALPELLIPKTLETVEYHTAIGPKYGPFTGCTALKNVTLEDGITAVPYGLFMGCPGFDSIVIPDSVTEIEDSAFSYCSALENITFSKNLVTIGHGAFGNCQSLVTVEIPDSVTEIGSSAFAYCKNLSGVKLSKNLKTIGRCAFADCTALPELLIPKTLETVWYHTAIGPEYGPFTGCTALKNVTLEDGITAVPYGLFMGCPGFDSIVIPDSVTKIGAYAFSYCSALKEITIPESVTEYGSAMFCDCSALTTAKLPSHWTEIPYHTFENCTALKTVDMPEGIKTIGKQAFYNCAALTEFKVPASVTIIDEYAFKSCDALESVTLNPALKTIAGEAFMECIALKNITIPDSVTAIHGEAFKNCDALTAANLGNGVKTIGGKCFYDCDALTDITMGNQVTEIGSGFAYHCDKLKNVTLSRNLSEISSQAFYECVELEEITIPYYVTEIGSNAFNSSPKLVKAVMHRNVEAIDDSAFSYPDRTVIYGVPGTYSETWANDNGYKFVANEVPVTAVALEAAELTMNRGSQKTLALTLTPADTTDVITWRTTNEKVVTVDDRGNVNAVGTGEATVKVNVGNQEASIKITVIVHGSSVSLNSKKLTLNGGDTYQLKATVKPENAINKDVVWESSNPEVATVDETGLVTALSKGAAEITVTMVENDVTNTCAVTVNNTQYMPDAVDGMESPHNYEANCTDSWKYSIPDAAMLAVTFDEKTELEDGLDYLYIYNAEGKEVGKYTGKALAGQTITLTGDTVVVKLKTDAVGNAWGFKVTNIEETHEHKYGDWSVTTEPTCTEVGVESRYCEVCGLEETREVKATGHKEVKDKAVAATCTEPGLTAGKHCETCGEVTEAQEEIPALGHKEQTIKGTAATCTKEGKTDGTKCSVCGEVLVEQEVIPALGHDPETVKGKEATCTETGLTDGEKCSVCSTVITKQEEIPVIDHKYTDGKCELCGEADPDFKPDEKPDEDVLRGDMDGNGKVNSDDAIYLLRHTLMASVYPIEQDGDMDGNGKVNSDDAIYLLRHTLLPSVYPLS